ncbi:hypothetical protein IJ095_01695 [Candidatus Saccharibacteria bacterium]|nr:hypothetical protein [Candidatus Saccharibacteria bacterium]
MAKFEAKIIGGSSSYEMGLGFEFVDHDDMNLAHFEIKGTALEKLARRFGGAKDVKLDVRPTSLEYEDGSHTGLNIAGTIDKNCGVEEFRGRPFKAYYNPKSLRNRGYIEIEL